jgi:fatty-acyl-CoA synthase
LARLCITWLHPLGSLEDQLFQLKDSEAEMLVVDAAVRDRGGALAAPGRPEHLRDDRGDEGRAVDVAMAKDQDVHHECSLSCLA